MIPGGSLRQGHRCWLHSVARRLCRGIVAQLAVTFRTDFEPTVAQRRQILCAGSGMRGAGDGRLRA